tara:strand:+ start:2338 stop:2916 length:579 start_codon:yes stop_codon:yes gene_type:complete
MSLGNYDSIYSRMYGNQRDNVSNMEQVNDPEAAFADITRQDYDDYLNNFRAFEERLLDATNDTSIIDNARENAPKQSKIAEGIAKRNTERYGGAGLSNVQKQEQQRAQQRGGKLNLAGGVNNARIQQRQVNQSTLQELIGIGQGVNNSAMQGLGDSAAMASQRRNAYGQAKANYSSQMTGLGTTMLLAAFGV